MQSQMIAEPLWKVLHFRAGGTDLLHVTHVTHEMICFSTNSFDNFKLINYTNILFRKKKLCTFRIYKTATISSNQSMRDFCSVHKFIEKLIFNGSISLLIIIMFIHQ